MLNMLVGVAKLFRKTWTGQNWKDVDRKEHNICITY